MIKIESKRVLSSLITREMGTLVVFSLLRFKRYYLIVGGARCINGQVDFSNILHFEVFQNLCVVNLIGIQMAET
ncbi:MULTISPECIES: hypothetical protein [Lysinibacillus]|uniref:hypothetical protein n=1 Tax=Lysinibacillus TaxID=400634 RepID=UPI00257B35D2|nr:MULTISPECIES: hypothetical protein [Lysinibacillus]